MGEKLLSNMLRWQKFEISQKKKILFLHDDATVMEKKVEQYLKMLCSEFHDNSPAGGGVRQGKDDHMKEQGTSRLRKESKSRIRVFYSLCSMLKALHSKLFVLPLWPNMKLNPECLNY